MCEILVVANPIPIPLNPWIEGFVAHSRPGSAHRDGSGSPMLRIPASWCIATSIPPSTANGWVWFAAIH